MKNWLSKILILLSIIGLAAGVGLRPVPASAQVQFDIVELLDDSDSIDPPEWDLIKEGVASAIEDLVPCDGTVSLTVFQFSTTVRLAIPRTVVMDCTVRDNLANQVRALVQEAALTNIGDTIEDAYQYITVEGDPEAQQIIDLVTDGAITTGPSEAETLIIADAAMVAGVECLNALGIADADMPFLTTLVRPQPDGGDCGFTAFAETFEDFADVFRRKFIPELRECCVELLKVKSDLRGYDQIIARGVYSPEPECEEIGPGIYAVSVTIDNLAIEMFDVRCSPRACRYRGYADMTYHDGSVSVPVSMIIRPDTRKWSLSARVPRIADISCCGAGDDVDLTDDSVTVTFSIDGCVCTAEIPGEDIGVIRTSRYWELRYTGECPEQPVE